MLKYYKEKALLATNNKIARLKKESGFFKKYWWQTILVGTIFTVLGPYYNSPPTMFRPREVNALEMSQTSHFNLSIYLAVFYSFGVIVGHLSWTYQEKSKMKRLLKRKEELENEIKALSKK